MQMQRAMQQAMFMRRCRPGVPTRHIPGRPTTIAAAHGSVQHTVPMASTIVLCRGRKKTLAASSGTDLPATTILPKQHSDW
jgi:hypothetical protein